MSKWAGLNRRKFPRVNYPCLVIIRHEGEKQSIDRDVILTHTENVGMGGLCVILKRDVKMFSLVELEVDLLDLGKHIKCEGKIVWNIKRRIDSKNKPSCYDIGIEFNKLTRKDEERLREVINRLVKNYEDISASHKTQQ